MVLIFILFILFTFWKCKFYGKSFYQDYISKQGTLPIKGFFVIIVFLSHMISYLTLTSPWDTPLKDICSTIGQLMVTMFLFYSGYGVYESIKHKKDYIRNFPKNRILKLLFEFDFVVLTYLVIDILLGKTSGKKMILFSLIGWESLGNSNWYIFAILSLYFITYLSFQIFKKSDIKALISVTVLSIVYILVVAKVKDGYWVNTILCYPLGMLFSMFRKQHEKLIFHNNRVYFLLLLITGFLFIAFYKHPIHLMVENITAILFTYLVVLITMKLEITNPVLTWYGKNLFWFYILQRIPMMLFQTWKIPDISIYLYAGPCFICATILTYFYSKLVPACEKYIWKK